MKNGIKIIRKTGRDMQSVFIPEEVVQIGQLNARIRQNVEAQEKAQAAEREEKARQLRKEEARVRKQMKVLKTCGAMASVTGLAWLCTALGLMDPMLAVLIGLPCLGGVCYQTGTLQK